MERQYKFSKMEIGHFKLKLFINKLTLFKIKRGYQIASFYVDEKFLIWSNLSNRLVII